MTQKVIALVDGSIYSASVCEHAAWISARTEAPVELIHVLGRREAPEKQDLSGSIRLGARTALLEELAELDAQRAKLTSYRGRAILDDARKILDEAGVTEITTRLRHGDIVETVAEVEADARVIVIGKRGEAADFAKGHLGSNLERIVRTAHKPIFVASRAFKPIEKVMVAYDGGVSAMKAIDHIARSPLFQGLSIHVVTVGAVTAEAKKNLEDAKAQLKAAGIEAETRVVEGRPDEALGKLVEGENFDMVVMGAYGHSRIRSMIIGSTTTEMVRSCKVPVVLMR
ncbi:Nucleotide-binding universal stress protein, UspA family [Salinihabitans flavidus]|uniref:Nucleotide-binding universal stress protein, UspA family n=1 Tax=Salinihabitans flavidus TaxID=569882 RepID=A0A1H8SJN1_9RHOB|nr:universal stress protein [Salinihabitans flavidus]SEO78757.1 Nucleotide-binding universal stress protein, UspA family [Salinihabitans flavidus]